MFRKKGVSEGVEEASSSTNQNERVALGEMTSKDYYFDSYAHFGIHEVFYCLFVGLSLLAFAPEIDFSTRVRVLAGRIRCVYIFRRC